MAELKLETQGTNTFLVLPLDESDVLDDFKYGMLCNNTIKGIIPIVSVEIDGQRILKYNVTSKTNLKNVLCGEVSKKVLLTILQKLCRTFEEMQEYMLEISDLCLEYEYIYIEYSKMEIEFICIPIECRNKDIDLREFFRNLLFKMNYRKNEDSTYVVKIINFINTVGPFYLGKFGKLINELLLECTNSLYPELNEKTGEKQAQVERFPIKDGREIEYSINTDTVSGSLTNPGNFTEKKVKKHPVIFRKKEKNKSKKQTEKISYGFRIPGEENQPEDKADVILQPEECVVKSKKKKGFFTDKKDKQKKKEQEQVPFLVQPEQIPGEKIEVTQKEFVITKDGCLTPAQPLESVFPYIVQIRTVKKMEIRYSSLKLGRKRDFVDFYIGDNKAVGRNHANIIRELDGYKIIDNNSINHTYVDGILIESGVPVKLKHGTRFTLADEEFGFYLY